jgi:threonine/homoserine/homoserine lactone efflux protein
VVDIHGDHVDSEFRYVSFCISRQRTPGAGNYVGITRGIRRGRATSLAVMHGYNTMGQVSCLNYTGTETFRTDRENS